MILLRIDIDDSPYFILWDSAKHGPVEGSRFMSLERFRDWMENHESNKIRRLSPQLNQWVNLCSKNGAGHESPAVTAANILRQSRLSIREAWERYKSEEKKTKRKSRPKPEPEHRPESLPDPEMMETGPENSQTVDLSSEKSDPSSSA